MHGIMRARRTWFLRVMVSVWRAQFLFSKKNYTTCYRKCKLFNQAWRQRQEDPEFKASPRKLASPSLKIKIQTMCW
jgi:hypothetical protein